MDNTLSPNESRASFLVIIQNEGFGGRNVEGFQKRQRVLNEIV